MRSVVDFLVEFNASPGINLFEAYLDLHRQVSDLLRRPVDRVMLSAFRNPYVRAGIEEQREPIYTA